MFDFVVVRPLYYGSSIPSPSYARTHCRNRGLRFACVCHLACPSYESVRFLCGIYESQLNISVSGSGSLNGNGTCPFVDCFL